jgi:asparagine synthase (glutamine-hydrolysing)
MRLLFGIISKRKNDSSSQIRKAFPGDSSEYAGLIFSDNDLRKVSRLNEIDENAPKGNIFVGYFHRKTNGDSILTPRYKIGDGDYSLLYGKIWDSKSPAMEDVKSNNLDGDYILVKKVGSRLLLSKDVVGIKQMYYGENGDVAGFSSRRRTLQELGIDGIRLLPGEIVELTRRGIVRVGLRRLMRPMTSIFKENIGVESYKESIINSVRRRVADVERIGIVFSGGIDSSLIALIAKSLDKDVICYCAGVPDSPDIITAEESADDLGLLIRTIKASQNSIEDLLPHIIRTIEDWNQLQVEAAIPVYCAMSRAAKDGVDVVLNGQGADELFAGYDWYPSILKRVGKEKLVEHMWEDLTLGYKETFERENKMAEFNDLELRVPYCDRNVIDTAMSISVDLKTKRDDDIRKYVHRKVGEELGLPPSIAWREKDAAQHASGVHEVVKSIAMDNGFDENRKYSFKTRFENLGSVYRYGNAYRTDKEEYGDDFVQAYFERMAIDLGITSVITEE